MKLFVDHELPGRVRFRVQAPWPASRVFDHLFAALDHEGGRFELSYDVRSRRFLLVFDRLSSLRQALDAAMDRPIAPSTEIHAGPIFRAGRPDEEVGPSSALRVIAPEVARYLLGRWLIPRPLAPFFTLVRVWPFLRDGIAEVNAGRLGVAALDGSAIASSLAMRDFRTASTIGFLLRLGELLADWSRRRARRSLAALFVGAEQHAWVARDGVEQHVPLAELVTGDLVIVRAGSRIPVDGVVRRGEAMVNQSAMTGEALPRRRAVGHSVYAGTVVEEGELGIEARKVGGETRFANIVRLLERSDALKAPITGEAERLAEWAVPYTFLLSGAVLLFTGNFVRAATVLVVDYSCALKLAAPLTIKAAMAEAATHGAVIKGGRPLETLSRADTFVFDKTGTLTRARPSVAGVHPFNGSTREYVLRNAACLEEHFPHPIGTAIVQQALAEDLHHEERHAEVQYVLAHGIESSLDGDRVLIGSRHFVQDDEGIDVSQAAEVAAACQQRGESVLYFTVGGELAGVIAIADPLQPEAPALIERLRKLGMARIVLLTGDDREAARAVAEKVGITEVHSEVLPDDKTRVIQDLRREGRVVVMVGDGMNDSAALAHADVGISMKHGADIAREACDVLLLDTRLEPLLTAVAISRRAMSRIRTEFHVTLGANSLFLALGLLGLAPAGLLALLHNATTVGICAWSVRPLLPEAVAGAAN
ncbi:MAG: heavy metal translocating P-type ATPase [Deltaproteobacteria bacterium]|nr:heavy metal translocating P-type ATPase [Deltaproteobacteria bacterium]